MEFPPPHETPASDPQSVDGWRTVSFITWISIFGALLAVAVSSRTIGRPVWWLGSSGRPAPLIFLTIPIVMTVFPIIVTIRQPHRMVVAGLISAIGLFAIAIPDFADSPGVALAVSVIAFAALIESIALGLVTRQYR